MEHRAVQSIATEKGARPVAGLLEPASPGPTAPASLAVALRWVAGFALALAALLAALLHFQVLDAGALIAALSRLEPQVIGLILGLSLTSYLVRGMKWHVMSRQVAPEVGLTRSIAYYCTGFAFTLTPAKVGELIRVWLLKSRHGVPYTRALPVLLVDRAVDLVLLVVLACLAASRQVDAIAAPLTVLAVFLTVVLLLSSRKLVVGSALYIHRLSGSRWPGLFRFALAAYRSLRLLCNTGVLWRAFALGAIAWGSQVVGLWILLNALGLPADLTFAALILASTLLVAIVPLFPGGIGGAEAVMTGFLIVAGMSPELAVTATLVNRLSALWFAVLIGFVTAPFTLAMTSPVAPRTTRS